MYNKIQKLYKQMSLKNCLILLAVVFLALFIFSNKNGKYQALGDWNKFTIIDTTNGEIAYICSFYNSTTSLNDVSVDIGVHKNVKVWSFLEDNTEDFEHYRCSKPE